MSGSGRAIARAGLIVTAAFFVSRVLGWVRIAVIGTVFGASRELDAYFAAFRIPDAIFQLVAAGALASALVPVVTEILAEGAVGRAWRVVSTVTNLMMIVAVTLAGIFALVAPVVMPAITPGFDALQVEQTVRLSRVMLLSPIFLALGAVATSVLNTLGSFGVAAAAPIVYNLGIIGGAVVLGPVIGVDGLAVGVVIGSAAHLAVQLPALVRRRFGYGFVLDLKDSAARQMLLLMAPRTLGLGATQLIFLVNTMFASGLGEGAISVYNVAFLVLQIPIGVIGVPLGIVLLPSMAQAMVAGATERFGDLVSRSLRLILFLMLPLTGLMVVLRRPGIGLLFEHGRFDAVAVNLTADTLLVFLLGLAAHAMIAILAPAFYAGKDTWTPVMAALLAVAVNIGVATMTIGRLGLSGLALAITLAAWVEAAVLLGLLRRRAPAVRLGLVARGFFEFALGGLLASLAALLVLRALDPLLDGLPTDLERLLELTAGGVAGAALYLAYGRLIRAPEVAALTSLLREFEGRRGRGAAPPMEP